MGKGLRHPRAQRRGAARLPAPDALLSRPAFREVVFLRDGNTCVVPGCGQEAVDAHHIVPRKAFTDGGYYLANGVSLCARDHLAAEQGTITPEQLRQYAGITVLVLPGQAAQPIEPPALA